MKSQGWINFVLSGQRKSCLPRKGNHLQGKRLGGPEGKCGLLMFPSPFFGEEVFVGVPERCCSGDESLVSLSDHPAEVQPYLVAPLSLMPEECANFTCIICNPNTGEINEACIQQIWRPFFLLFLHLH